MFNGEGLIKAIKDHEEGDEVLSVVVDLFATKTSCIIFQ